MMTTDHQKHHIHRLVIHLILGTLVATRRYEIIWFYQHRYGSVLPFLFCSSNCIHRSTIAIINSTTKCITCENIGCSTLETTISREAHLKEDYTIQSGFIFLEHSFINSNAGKYQKAKNYLYFAAQIMLNYSEWQAICQSERSPDGRRAGHIVTG